LLGALLQKPFPAIGAEKQKGFQVFDYLTSKNSPG
jgi:hypothetical protein